MVVLITGGAGYIGSHVAKQLLERDEDIIILDLYASDYYVLEKLREIREFVYYQRDLSDWKAIEEIFQNEHNSQITAILHFAASLSVPESVSSPLKYYLNNTANTANLINCAVKYGIPKFIFSSTAATYGETDETPVSEDRLTNPVNPYGQSKLMSERILQDTARAHPSLKYIIFRYFNVAGADTSVINPVAAPRFGHGNTSCHLIKIAAECACGKRSSITIYGTDFNTRDGTGVRDYIHVDDLASAHIKGLDYLENNPSDIFNVGYGRGYTVKEVIDTMKLVTGIELSIIYGDRRAGDPSAVVANNEKICAKMGWKPRYDNLEMICHRSYLWECGLK